MCIAYGGQRSMIGIFCNHSWPWFLRQELSLNLELGIWLASLATELQASPCLWLPRTGIKCTSPWLNFHGCWWPKLSCSGLHNEHFKHWAVSQPRSFFKWPVLMLSVATIGISMHIDIVQCSNSSKSFYVLRHDQLGHENIKSTLFLLVSLTSIPTVMA